jgi:formylmethanofuran dehydrogenase subunit B
MIDFNRHPSSYDEVGAACLRQPSGYRVGIISRKRGGYGRNDISLDFQYTDWAGNQQAFAIQVGSDDPLLDALISSIAAKTPAIAQSNPSRIRSSLRRVDSNHPLTVGAGLTTRGVLRQ